MLKMLTLHCYTGFSPKMHGLMDALKNASSVVDQGTAILLCCSSFSVVSTVEAYTTFLGVLKENNQGDEGLMNSLARLLLPAFLSIAHCRLSQGNFWWCY
jgi:hypothetical protein